MCVCEKRLLLSPKSINNCFEFPVRLVQSSRRLGFPRLPGRSTGAIKHVGLRSDWSLLNGGANSASVRNHRCRPELAPLFVEATSRAL